MKTGFMQTSLISASMLLAAGSLFSASASDHPQLSDLPTLYITTDGGVDIVSKEDYIRASIVWVDEEGEKVYDNNLGIRGRGNSTWGFAKKPYRIKFDKKTEFLGPDRAKAKSWTLLANFADKTLIRNAVAACIGSFAGQPFTAAAEFVDVVLNGTYLGNYQISDQMEIREKRVNITEQDEPATPESDISGGYFLEVDGFAYNEPVNISTRRGVMITVKSPDDDVINDAQIAYIRNHMISFEDALFSDDFSDPEKGYRKYVDPSTLASWYIATELTGNVDGFWSTYIYKEKGDDKIYWGPLWDYDIAFNNCDRVGDVSRKLMTDVGFGDDLTNVWVKRMWQDPWFANLINDTWRDLVADGIEKHVCDYIDSLAARLERSQQLNFDKWPINRHDYNEIVLFDTYAEGIDYLKSFIKNHVAYLTVAFQQRVDNLDIPSGPSQPFELQEGYLYRIFNKGNMMNIGVSDDGSAVCLRDNDPDNASLDWVIGKADDFYTITNRSNGFAITDVAEYGDSHYQAGSQLEMKSPDETDFGQQWIFTPVADGSTYCVVSRKTSLAWNNSGGGAVSGNPVISWNNDADNSSKVTRQWIIRTSAKIEGEDPGDKPGEDPGENPEDPDDGQGVSSPADALDYRVSYIPELRQLRFVSADGSLLSGEVKIYAGDGRMLLDAPVEQTVALPENAAGVLIATWIVDGKRHTVRFIAD